MDKITLDQANVVIAEALAKSRREAFRPMAVVVVDEAGQPRSLQREDGASMLRIDIATAKAWAAISMGASSRELGERARDNPIFYTSLAAASQGRFLAQTGAVLIRSATGIVVGAVGASGGTGDEDELICRAGVEAAGFSHA